MDRMHHLIAHVSVVLYWSLATALLTAAWLMPGEDLVTRTFDQSGQITKSTLAEIQEFRNQLKQLQQPEYKKMIAQLENETSTFALMVEQNQIDFQGLKNTQQVLKEARTGLTGFSKSLDVNALTQVRTVLTQTADVIDKQLIPSSTSIANDLEKSGKEITKDVQTIAKLLGRTPNELETLEKVQVGLKGFGEGLDALDKSLNLKALNEIKDGAQGMSLALGEAADQVEELADYTYPTVTIENFRPKVEQTPFWSRGKKVAEGLRKATKGLKALDEQLKTLKEKLPEVQKSLKAGGLVVKQSEQSLAETLKEAKSLKPLLENISKGSVALVQQVPSTALKVAGLLRQTKELAKVSKGLREADKTLGEAAKHWPTVQKSLSTMANTLGRFENRLSKLLKHQDDYERAWKQTQGFAVLLPRLTKQVVARLESQEKSLEELTLGLEGINESLPEYQQSGIWVVRSIRAVLVLSAVLLMLQSFQLTWYRRTHP